MDTISASRLPAKGGIWFGGIIKNKNKGLDAKLALATKWVGGVFIVLTLVLNLF